MTAESSETWATASVAGKVVTVKVSANSGEERTAIITVRADNKVAKVNVTQAGV